MADIKIRKVIRLRSPYINPLFCSISCIIRENAPRWSSSFLSPQFCIECFLPPSSYDPPTLADKLMVDNYPQDDPPPFFSSYSVAEITEESRGGEGIFSRRQPNLHPQREALLHAWNWTPLRTLALVENVVGFSRFTWESFLFDYCLFLKLSIRL